LTISILRIDFAGRKLLGWMDTQKLARLYPIAPSSVLGRAAERNSQGQGNRISK